MKLHIFDDLPLPDDLAVNVTLIAGKRGSGKTTTAKRTVEQIHRAHVPFGIIDPVDVWHGLKAGADGRPDGGLKNVYVFGGKHADAPLEPTGGALMAQTFVEHRISGVMVVRGWTHAEVARFCAAFADTLFQLNKDPFTLVVEEAHRIMPQKPFGEQARSLDAMLQVELLGRSSGLGLMLLTQRLARLHKDATTQADVLVMHRTVGPQDMKSLGEWVEEHHVDKAAEHEFLASLPKLKTGEVQLWAPDFPEDKPLGLVRVKALMCDTFNSHATPKVGERRPEPTAYAPVDLAALGAQMTATVERIQQNDPVQLRRTIADLRAELTRRDKAPVTVPPERVEVPVITTEQLQYVDKLSADLHLTVGVLGTKMEPLLAAYHEISSALSAVSSNDRRPVAGAPVRRNGEHVDGTSVRAGGTNGARSTDRAEPAATVAGRRSTLRSPNPARTQSDFTLSKADRTVLTVLANETDGCSATQLALLAGYRYSGGFRNILSKLRTAGLIEGDNGATIWMTEAGLAAEEWPRRPTGQALRDWWLTHRSFRSGERTVLGLLIDAYPKALTGAQLCELSGYQWSGGFRNILSKLRTAGVLVGKNTEPMRASDLLFA